VYLESVCSAGSSLTAGLCSLDLDTLLDDFGVDIGVLGFLCMLEALCVILVYLEALGAFF
jgi:hypothetical protein